MSLESRIIFFTVTIFISVGVLLFIVWSINKVDETEKELGDICSQTEECADGMSCVENKDEPGVHKCKRNIGHECNTISDCVGSAKSCTSGVCSTLKPSEIGESCINLVCADGLVCSSGKCKSAPGGSCGTISDCIGSKYCIDEICRENAQSEGSKCDTKENPCIPGLTCINNICHRGVFTSCRSTRECSSTTVCHKGENSENGMCLAPPDRGERCILKDGVQNICGRGECIIGGIETGDDILEYNLVVKDVLVVEINQVKYTFVLFGKTITRVEEDVGDIDISSDKDLKRIFFFNNKIHGLTSAGRIVFTNNSLATKFRWIEVDWSPTTLISHISTTHDGISIWVQGKTTGYLFELDQCDNIFLVKTFNLSEKRYYGPTSACFGDVNDKENCALISDGTLITDVSYIYFDNKCNVTHVTPIDSKVRPVAHFFLGSVHHVVEKLCA